MAKHDIEECIETLEHLVDNPMALARVTIEQKKALMRAAGRLSAPDRREARTRRKARGKVVRADVRDKVAEIVKRTGMRKQFEGGFFETPPALPHVDASAPEEHFPEPQQCYVCKVDFTKVHHFYDQMCPECADFNFAKRSNTADLEGRTAIITGARVKIGYQAAIMLLRAGAKVVVVTRFPNDAASRYAAEKDFASFQDRLQICGVDLRHTPSVEAFCDQMIETLPSLDFLLNNACQTVRRPAGFYQHLISGERDHKALPAEASGLVKRETYAGIVDSVALSQATLLEEDVGRDLALFPEGKLDVDQQQIDLRGINSWRLRLHEVSTVELLEVQLVNAVAPFVLNSRLKPLMMSTPSKDKHIVNVSAVEGQFYRRFKTDKHPHTNMAKAALNMMTRTSGYDYKRDGIHMNSVDTGWVTDEDPAEIAARKQKDHAFYPPLDIVDGAARIVDPIFDGINTGEHTWGKFLKDYRSVPW